MRITKLIGITILMIVLLPIGMIVRCIVEAFTTFQEWCEALSKEWQL